MGREILFRGIDEKGNWQYGTYYYGCMYPTSHLDHYINDWQINPETIGQYTELTDKNGSKIFEGDIVRFPELYETPEMTNTYYTAAKVIFIHGAFHIQQSDEKITPDTYNLAYEMHCYDGNFEIIGNIYQNAELLSKKTYPISR